MSLPTVPKSCPVDRGDNAEAPNRERKPLGPVREAMWHFRGARYKYYIEENGKKVSTRSLAGDLAPARPVPDSAFRTPRSAFFPCSS
ncbi:hypothetical protein VT84_00120 [Gemmata sp. SH-PL17]|nr:hypothetical protein VT84_00120 [Gemmata sp. SH-PL17]